MDGNDYFSNNSEPKESCTPEDLKDVTRNVSLNFLPEKSKQKYEKRYELFTSWCERKNVKIPSENVLLEYLVEHSKVMKSSTLWGVYSMLKATIQIKDNIDISNYNKLTDFLKKMSVGYEPKKSKILSQDEVETFLRTAPDDIYLMKKVVLIFGLAGACRCDELTKLQVNNIEDKGSLMVVKIPYTKTNKSRTFIVTNDDGNDIDYLNIIRKYLELRPPGLSTGRLFLKYCKGVCIKQNVGLNTIGKVPKDIATFLKLPDPLEYTGHCFRRTSATLLAPPRIFPLTSAFRSKNSGKNKGSSRKDKDEEELADFVETNNVSDISDVDSLEILYPSTGVKETSEGQKMMSGVPILTSVKPPHSHPPSDDPQLDRQCAQARMQIRELCLGDRKLKPGDVLAAVSASASDPVREYIERHKMTIKRDIREWRSCKDPTELKDEDDLLSVTKSRKMASKKSTVGRRKKEVESTASETASGQDDSSSLPLPEQDAVPGPSTSGRNIETVVVKEERVKEELDIEDYGDPSDFLEFQTHEGVEGVRNVGENTEAVLAKPSSSGGAGGPFETIICGGDVQIKQEVFEDERDCFNSGMEVDPTLPWPAPSTTGIAEPLSSVTPTCGPPTNFYHVPSSSGTTSQVHPPPKKMKQRVKSNILRSQQMLKAVPSLSLEKCKICTEVFSSPSDLVEHCILRHSDASSKFLPTAEPSIPEHLKPAETFGMIPPTTSGFSAATPPAFSAATTPGFSAATTPGFSAATTPELNVANPPGQPPQNWIPPYISACDVFDGVFVSLRNIPVENRKATRDKILELVNFLSKEKVNPSTVSFSVEEK